MLTDLPQVSVVVPVFNRADVIGRCIESILAQTMVDWELYVVDDCSTDNTTEVIGHYEDPRIHCVRLQEKAGAPVARNVGIKKSRGRFIALLDSDDAWLPLKLEQQLAVFSSADERVGVVYCGMIKHTASRVVESYPKLKGNLLSELLVKNVIVGSTSAVLIKRDVFDNVGLFDERFPALQDIELFIRIARQYSFDFANQLLVQKYFERPDRISRRRSARARGQLKIFRKHGELYRQQGKLTYLLNRTAQVMLNQKKVKVARLFAGMAMAESKLQWEPYKLWFQTFLEKKG